MSAYNALDLVLSDILLNIEPSRDDWALRLQIINEFQALVRSVESLRGATVRPFGSFVSNLFMRLGDLDISIELLEGLHTIPIAKKGQQNLLEDIATALRRAGGWRKVQFIPNARVPILKVDSNHQNISCDISVNNLKGLLKSKCLFWISGIDSRFRELVLLVKEWAKAHGINNPKAGTLNSFSITLLVVFHFQTCEPAILPPLNQIYPASIVDEISGVRDAVEKQVDDICASNIAKFTSQRRRLNRSSLSELFISFLAKFSDIKLRVSEQGICPFTGEWMDISSNMRWQPKTYALFIEDPFEQPENTARTVASGQLMKISEAFRATHRHLSSSNQDHNSIIAALVRPRVMSLNTRLQPVQRPIVRPRIMSLNTRLQPVQRPSISGSHLMPYPQVRQPSYMAPAQLVPQFQNMSVHAQPNPGARRRPTGPFQGQRKGVWRPKAEISQQKS